MDKGGTGLGLTISKRYIELMGGELDLESPFSILLPPKVGGQGGREKEGKGSRFFFTMPFEPAKREIPETARQMDREVVHLADGYRVKALVVDDVAENRDILSKFLTAIGVEVRQAENGRGAIEQTQESLPDIVFMDVRMPEINGPEAAQKIWEEFGHAALKIVAVSASTLAHEQEGYLSLGFDAFISKPFRTEQIYDCLSKFLGVEYQYADEDETLSDSTPLNLEEITIPEDLLSRLKAAAESYRVGELKKSLGALEQAGEDGQRLGAHLRGFVNNYDMEAILDILTRIGIKE